MSDGWDKDAYGAVPEIPLQNLPSNVNIGTIAPVFGVASDAGADYLDINIHGRSFYQQLLYNTGTAYLGGIVLGGAYGAVEGLREAPSHKFKIRLNSVLNASGKRGSKAGNALGSLGTTICTID